MNEWTPRISVIVPAYNAEAFLRDTVESVKAQTFRDWELILVNDGSTDGTQKIIDEYVRKDARIRSVNQSNAGASAARNAGFAKSSTSSEFVIFLDSDDVWEPHTLEILSKELENHPEAIGAHGLAKYIDAHGKTFNEGALEKNSRRRAMINGRLGEIELDAPTTFSCLAVRCWIHTTGLALLKKQTVANSGLFEVSLPVAEDWFFWLRLSRFGNFIFVNQVLLGYRQTVTGLSRNKSRMRKYKRKVRRILVSSPEFSNEQRVIAKETYRLLQQEQKADYANEARKCIENHQWVEALKQYLYVFRCSVREARGCP